MRIQITDNANILLFGDSISKGIIYDNILCKYIKAGCCFYNIVSSKIKATISNVSRFGNTVLKADKQFNDDLEKYNPHITVIELGGNDCDFCWEQIAENPEGHHLPRTTPEQFKSLITDFIHRLENKNIQPVLLTMPPIDPIRYFKWICRGIPSFEKNILAWLGTENAIYWWHEQYNLMLIEIADKKCVPIIDIRKRFLSHRDIRQFLCDDGIHPNEKGHKIIAETILSFIKENYPKILK